MIARPRISRLLPTLVLLAGCMKSGEALRVLSPYVEPTTLKVGEILHLATGRLLSEPEALEYVARFPVIYVGEAHDSIDDHDLELKVLRAVEERFPGQVALGLEMLQRPYQTDADAYVRGDLSEKDFERVWRKSWAEIGAYREILGFVRERRIPLVALNASTPTRRAVREKPLAGLAPEMAERLPEMDFQDRYHRAEASAIFSGHAKAPTDPDAFYRVQVLWDETMAQTAAEYLGSPAGRGRRLIVLAGGNHVRYGVGIPRRLFRRLPLPFVIVEPYVNPTLVQVPKEKLMDVEAPELPFRSADIYWSVDYRDVRERQARLGILVEDAAGGARVTQVLPEGPGRKAGLLDGDIIVAIDGVTVKESFDFLYEVGQRRPGEVGSLEVLRAGQRMQIPVTYEVIK